MARNAFSYIRMSTKSQRHGDSRRRQLENSMEFAKKHKLNFVNTIEDIGVSAYRGKNIKGGELGVFRQALLDGAIDPSNTVLLVESFDRLSRDNPLSAISELNKFLETGISVITIVDGEEYSLQTIEKKSYKLQIAIGIMIRANEESENKSRLLLESWKNKRENIKNTPLTSKAPAWLVLNKKTKEFDGENDQPADTIRKVFDLCIDENMGATSIAKFLNDNIDQYPKFTKPRIKKNINGWHESYIKKILNNPAVYGEFQPRKLIDGKRIPDGESIEGYFPVVVEKDRFILAQAKIAERKVSGAGRKGNKFTNLFSSLVTCGNCGGKVVILNKGIGSKGGIYLKCYNSKSNNQCSCPAWKYDEFENSFFDFIYELPLKEVFLDGDEQSKEKKLREELTILNSEIRKTKKAITNLTEMLGNVKPVSAPHVINQLDVSSEELEKLKSKKKLLKIDIARIENRNVEKSHKELIDLIRVQYTELPEDDLKIFRRKINSIIREVVSGIVINNAHLPITSKDAIEKAPKNLLEELSNRKKGQYNTNEKLAAVFDTEYGKRLYSESEKSYSVRFESGPSKTVYPYKNISTKGQRVSIDDYMDAETKKELIDRIKNRWDELK